jgi:hypothetical protein
LNQQEQPTPDSAHKIRLASAMMNVIGAQYELAVATGTYPQYVNAVLFTAAAVMANSSDAEFAKMMGYLTAKVDEIRKSNAAKTQETSK